MRPVILILRVTLALLVVGLIAVAFMAAENLPLLVAKIASAKINRDVSIGDLKVAWDPEPSLELRDLHLANASFGTKKDMVTIGDLKAVFFKDDLLKGTIKFDNITIDGLSIFLERDKDGVGNWKFSEEKKPSPKNGSHPGEESRRKLPTVLNFHLHDGDVVMKTSGGGGIDIALKDFDLKTPSEVDPVTIDVEGAYNATPVHLAIKTDTFNAFHDFRHPFAVTVAGRAATMTILLQASMWDPLNFDAVQSRLQVDIKNLGRTTALFGPPIDAPLPLHLDSFLKRNGDSWQFSDVTGSIASNELEPSTIELNEGARLKPDDLKANLVFKKLNVDRFSSGSAKKSAFSFPTLEKNPGTLLDVNLSANDFKQGALDAHHLKLHADLKPDEAHIDNLAMGIFGGEFHGSVDAIAAKRGNRITAKAGLFDADFAHILDFAKVKGHIAEGKLATILQITSEGETLTELKRSSRGYMAFSMDDGLIPLRKMRLAALDLGALFTSPSETTELNCLLLVLDFNKGVAKVSPLKIESSAGNLSGLGTIDFTDEKLDLTFQTDHSSTDSFALDKPIRVKGSFDQPQITPLLLSSHELSQNAADLIPNEWAPSLASFLGQNRCH